MDKFLIEAFDKVASWLQGEHGIGLPAIMKNCAFAVFIFSMVHLVVSLSEWLPIYVIGGLMLFPFALWLCVRRWHWFICCEVVGWSEDLSNYYQCEALFHRESLRFRCLRMVLLVMNGIELFACVESIFDGYVTLVFFTLLNWAFLADRYFLCAMPRTPNCRKRGLARELSVSPSGA